jgi:hypothetical protein
LGPPAFFLPQLLMQVTLLYWAVRVRFPGWAGTVATAPSLSAFAQSNIDFQS